MGKGQLAIAVDREQAVIFVDGQIRGLGRAALSDLVPGVYRVFVQVPATAGRQYEVEVNADELAELRVDWDVDSTLAMTDRWVGLLFATEADRAREAALAGKLARRWHQLIAVVGVVHQGGTVSVTARLYDPTGTAVRGARVTLDGDDHKLRSLAQYLADGIAGDGVDALGPVVSVGATVRPREAPPATRPAPRSRLVPALLVGAGAAAVLAGGALYVLDQDATPDMPNGDRNTAPVGLALGTAGLAAVGVGLWMWRSRGRSSAPIVVLGCCGGFFGWAGEL
jgi:hypothetical protein